jgi:hypothetical protein
MDRAIIDLLKEEKLYPADFSIRCGGVARLNPQLARRVLRIVAIVLRALSEQRRVVCM